jgi:hypothetical protein
MGRTIAALAAGKFEQRAVQGTAPKISTFLKCSPPKSGDRGVTESTMKVNDADISGGSQRELAAGVLKQAAQDLRRFHGATSTVERKLYFDAYSWVMSSDYSWPFSFPNVCRILNRAPEELRQELVGDLSFGTFRQWARRCSRAVRRFSDSLTQRLPTEYDLSAAPRVRLVQTWH